MLNISALNHPNTQARIYAVDKTTNEVVRVSKSYQAALEFQASSRDNAKSLFLCNSEVTLKKGDVVYRENK